MPGPWYLVLLVTSVQALEPEEVTLLQHRSDVQERQEPDGTSLLQTDSLLKAELEQAPAESSTRGFTTATPAVLEEAPPTVLAGGFSVNDTVLFTGASQVFLNGDRVVYGGKGVVRGPSSKSTTLSVLFEGNNGTVAVAATEISYEVKGTVKERLAAATAVKAEAEAGAKAAQERADAAAKAEAKVRALAEAEAKARAEAEAKAGAEKGAGQEAATAEDAEFGEEGTSADNVAAEAAMVREHVGVDAHITNNLTNMNETRLPVEVRHVNQQTITSDWRSEYDQEEHAVAADSPEKAVEADSWYTVALSNAKTALNNARIVLKQHQDDIIAGSIAGFCVVLLGMLFCCCLK